ncbi:hypothetical protein [Streptomyces sp. NPDC058412]|uniref:hypothetical protein n=1 Tax=Streptomyces sp. NPDC058412 TaxID=3346486 RepID=UPI00365D3D68
MKGKVLKISKQGKRFLEVLALWVLAGFFLLDDPFNMRVLLVIKMIFFAVLTIGVVYEGGRFAASLVRSRAQD